MKYKIVADSSADMTALEGVPFASVPLKIVTKETEYFDDASLDTHAMVEHLLHYTGRVTTACPAPHEFFRAFGDADRVFCVTISGALSGSYNAARIAKEEYEEIYPDRKVFLIDSLSAGMELRLTVEKLAALIGDDESFDAITEKITAYTRSTGLRFLLSSVRNLANNGRLSPIAARVVGLLGIRIVGEAGPEGTVDPTHKCRGRKQALATLWKDLLNGGYNGGKLRIGHCENPEEAAALAATARAAFPHADVAIHSCRGLCSFYAEKGGLMIGFEKG